MSYAKDSSNKRPQIVDLDSRRSRLGGGGAHDHRRRVPYHHYFWLILTLGKLSVLAKTIIVLRETTHVRFVRDYGYFSLKYVNVPFPNPRQQ